MIGFPKPSLFTFGTQKRKIYDALLLGPVTNEEMARDLKVLKYTGRISEMREVLQDQGVTIIQRSPQKGLHFYELKRFL